MSNWSAFFESIQRGERRFFLDRHIQIERANEARERWIVRQFNTAGRCIELCTFIRRSEAIAHVAHLENVFYAGMRR